MAVGTLVVELIGAFLLAFGILWSYGNIPKATPAVVIAVIISWTFSLMIVTILPNDISATFYRQCLKNEPDILNLTTTTPPPVDIYNAPTDYQSENFNVENGYEQNYPYDPARVKREMVQIPTTAPLRVSDCIRPVSYVSEEVIPTLYRIVYWSTQLLTYFLIPFLSSYVQAGEFTILAKMKTALIDNAIYYGFYLLIFVILLVYAAASTKFDLSWTNLKLFGITAANTWGLFLLVLLLGYGLVEIPRTFWHKSSITRTIEWEYFNLAKITEEKHEAVEELESVLLEAKKLSLAVRLGHPSRPQVNTIIKKCPESFQDEIAREQADFREYNDANVPGQR